MRKENQLLEAESISIVDEQMSKKKKNGIFEGKKEKKREKEKFMIVIISLTVIIDLQVDSRCDLTHSFPPSLLPYFSSSSPSLHLLFFILMKQIFSKELRIVEEEGERKYQVGEFK